MAMPRSSHLTEWASCKLLKTFVNWNDVKLCMVRSYQYICSYITSASPCPGQQWWPSRSHDNLEFKAPMRRVRRDIHRHRIYMNRIDPVQGLWPRNLPRWNTPMKPCPQQTFESNMMWHATNKLISRSSSSCIVIRTFYSHNEIQPKKVVSNQTKELDLPRVKVHTPWRQAGRLHAPKAFWTSDAHLGKHEKSINSAQTV